MNRPTAKFLCVLGGAHLVVLAVFLQRFPLIWLPGALGVCLGAVWLFPFFLDESPERVFLSLSLGCAVYGSWLSSMGAETVIIIAFGVLALIALFGGLYKAGWSFSRGVIWLILALVMATAVANLSGSGGGAGGMLVWFRTWLHVPDSELEQIVHDVRKTIHFSFYGSFAAVSSFASRAGQPANRSAIVFSLASTLILATYDEGRQAFSPGRTSSPWDVLLDMSGAFAFLIFVHYWTYLKSIAVSGCRYGDDT